MTRVKQVNKHGEIRYVLPERKRVPAFGGSWMLEWVLWTGDDDLPLDHPCEVLPWGGQRVVSADSVKFLRPNGETSGNNPPMIMGENWGDYVRKEAARPMRGHILPAGLTWRKQ